MPLSRAGPPQNLSPPPAHLLAHAQRRTAWDKFRSVRRRLRTEDQQDLIIRAHLANWAAARLLEEARVAGSFPVVPLRWYKPSDTLESAIRAFDYESDPEEEAYFHSLPLDTALETLEHQTHSLLLTSAQLERVTQRPHPSPTIRDSWLPLVRAVETLESARHQTEVIVRNPKQDYAQLPQGAAVAAPPSAARSRRAEPFAAQAPPTDAALAQEFQHALQLPLPDISHLPPMFSPEEVGAATCRWFREA